jgi:phosphoribosylformylglycinamidine synthase II
MTYKSIQTILKPEYHDTFGEIIRNKCVKQLKINTGGIKRSKFFTVDYDLSDKEIHEFTENCLKNRITDIGLINEFYQAPGFKSLIAVAQLPGVTDDVGVSAQMALADFLNKKIDLNVQHIYTQNIFYFKENLSNEELLNIAKSFLGNPLIHHFQTCIKKNETFDFYPYVPKVELHIDETVEEINMNLNNNELEKLSEDRILALSLDEMKAIRSYFRNSEIIKHRIPFGLSEYPTDVELEVFAQTWSEHCKHKEFNAEIEYENKHTGERKVIDSLFKTYIKGSTDLIQKHLEANKNNWLIKVFSDNAGTVRANKDKLFVWKVETHNSPSALDPYGGAITGILGVNRDIMGTGIGGAELLFNTNVLCFGPPSYNKKLLKGQLHPKRIMDGVVDGIEDGGNKSGIPTINGAVLFDERFAGKPLVFCGTAGLMPVQYKGRNSWVKQIDPYDRIIMAGGRVGKDGIHGATFSSTEINEKSPVSAVQIGSPITQKKLSDFMIIAAEQGLIKCSTDNGAGGLSSSIGELAEITGGAVVELDKVPLKYSGLKPWEIFVSESQERMTIVVEPPDIPEFFDLARNMEVEITDIGYFTDSGYLDVRFNTKTVNYLQLDFLHNGVPQKKMQAEYNPPICKEPDVLKIDNYNDILIDLLKNINICSRENIIRKYDHEVKGRTIIKPLMGEKGIQPQDAGVMRLDHEGYEGIAVSNGIMPKFGDIDAYEMSCGAFDEAVRQIIAVGGCLPNTKQDDGVFWTVNDNFCVPDSSYHPKKNPDGKEKLAKLVQMCEGLYDMSTYFDIPMTSGKDSMKNDFKSEGQKISVPPTILYSMAAKINDIRKTITSGFKAEGDLIYQAGRTYDELGGSEFYKLFGELGANVPKVRKDQAKALYLSMMKANESDLIESAHDLSDGGLAVALAECLLGTDLGAEIDLEGLGELPLNAKLFAESHSRFVVSIKSSDKEYFESIFGLNSIYLGKINNTEQLTIKEKGKIVINENIANIMNAWRAEF